MSGVKLRISIIDYINVGIPKYKVTLIVILLSLLLIILFFLPQIYDIFIYWCDRLSEESKGEYIRQEMIEKANEDRKIFENNLRKKIGREPKESIKRQKKSTS